MKLSADARIAYEIILENPGVHMITIAYALKKKHSVYGMQRAATRAIAELRRGGLVVDCPRCPACGRSVSRHHRNVPLYATNYKGPRGFQPLLL